MKITLAIISYNAEKTIETCLDSCVNQTYKDLDIIVVDDNSNDKTVELIKAYQKADKRINLVIHKANKSALQARKTAVKHARSEYVWFIDSDDFIGDIGAVGFLTREIKKNNYPDMITFGSKDYYETGAFKRAFHDWGREKELAQWKVDSDFRPYTRITKIKVLNKAIKAIPDDLYLYRHNDLFMFCLVKLCTNSKATINKEFYHYTLSSNSVTNQKDKTSISKHIKYLDFLLEEYKKAAYKIKQSEVNIDTFVESERQKLVKYVTQQYKNHPETYLHTLKELNAYTKDIIISLTTYSKRIETVDKVIISLLKQTISVDKIILWLDEKETDFSKLPSGLTQLVSDKFEIKFCPNYKSYKKLIPTLQLYPDATIITFDDDIDYPEEQVEKLLLAHFENPHEVITNVARNILVKNGLLQPYSTWDHAYEEQVGIPHLSLLPIGVGGVLYPHGSLNNEVLNTDKFIELAPHGDDLWFKCMTLWSGRKVIATGAGYKLGKNQLAGTEDIGLWQSVNEGTDSNFEQLLNIVNNYQNLSDYITSDAFSKRTISSHSLLEFYAELTKLKKKPKSSLNQNDASTALTIIKKLTFLEFNGKGGAPLDTVLKLNVETPTIKSNYSPFKLANRLFIEKQYYEAALIYKFLDKINPDFKYYKENYYKAVKILEIFNGQENFELADNKYFHDALNLIARLDNSCPESYINEINNVSNL